MFQNIALNILLTVFIVFISVPPVLFIYVYLKDRRQSQHSILRNFPLLGRIRYIFEMMGPELRQYMFDSDHEGKPFSRTDFANIVVAGKYLKTLIAFGSKRDFDKSGWYLKNSMFPKLSEEMRVVCAPKIKTKRYVGTEGL
ncbi:MAG: FMN-binding glutamate synthase family protein, partial [Candidatus Marinimicrobia bacterium]|nr:FMN-binding glutamate synthase family protein [Candidatus Neomarinimicrobiota bacterium]